MSVSIEQIWDILASRPKFVFNPTLIFVAQYVLIIVVHLFCENVLHYYWNDFSFREMTFFVRPLKNANFRRDYYPSCATSCNKYTDLQYFCPHNPLFYHLKLIPFHYWSKKCLVLVNTFVRHTFPVSKSSIKTKTVLTMTDMTESTELPDFRR